MTGPVDIGWTRAARRPARSRFELAWDAIRALGPVHAIAVLIAIAGLVMYVNDGPTIASAKELTRSGVAATATSSEVLLVKGSGGRGGPYAALDSVRVHIDGGSAPVELAWKLLPSIEDPDRYVAGWQAPTSETGYVAPFALDYITAADGSVVAMADPDLPTWADDDMRVGDAVFSGLGVLLFGLASIPMVRRGAQRRRRRAQRQDSPGSFTNR